MKEGLVVMPELVIPGHELELSASKASGPGGQHVNKANTRITIRWNVSASSVLSDEQKERIHAKLGHHLGSEGYIVVHSSDSRSQEANRKHALERLARLIAQALFVPKRRMKTRISATAVEERLREKEKRSATKKMRRIPAGGDE